MTFIAQPKIIDGKGGGVYGGYGGDNIKAGKGIQSLSLSSAVMVSYMLNSKARGNCRI